MSCRVTIVGGGNLGLACAAKMAAHGVPVTLYTSTPEAWTKQIATDDCDGNRFEGLLCDVTADPRKAVAADLIFLCLPGNAFRGKLAELMPHLKKETTVAATFSGDGFFFVAEEMLGTSWPVMGFQRVPFICRTKIPHRLGGITGYKKELFLAHRNVDDVERWKAFFETVFDTKTSLLDNFYEAALVNGNVVLHPARLMSLQKRIDAEGPFQRMPLFYEEWDDVASEWAIRIDEELRAVATRFNANIRPFLEYYESADAQSLTRKIQSIPAFRGIGSPITPAGHIDFSSRYVQADVEIALANVVCLANKMGLPCPYSTSVMNVFHRHHMSLVSGSL